MHSGGKEYKNWDSEKYGLYESFYAIEKKDLAVITIRSVVRKDEAKKISNDIVQMFAQDGVTLVDLGVSTRPIKQREYEEYLGMLD